MDRLDGFRCGVHPRFVPRIPRSPKRSYHHGDLRRALLDAALHILGEEGAHALTLREVARRVGVTQAAPYHHFADKEAILAAVAEEGFVELHTAMTGASTAAGNKAAPRLRAMARAYVHFAVEHPAHFRVMFGQLVDIPKHPALHTAADRAFTTLVEGIVEGQKAGITRKGNPIELAYLAWASVHGLAMLWIEHAIPGPGDCTATIEGLAESTADIILRGLAR